ncbi:sigma-70 family RNA polymerase sigma factor [Psychromicrobium lacuslunae]|uniref:sigma-70 family RNA polymerase sigma factor n=1 Tax=Psychromicrobium lacuslunae TaxID=1618207 RepID=UPI0006990D71|nr:sigma-70 family RNA polymerase sigma factor [Psychromicrobium lacuslunae]
MDKERGPFGQVEEAEVVGDGELILKVRAGDAGAFEILFKRHQAVALAVARKNSDNSSDAEDAVSEAFSSVFQSLREGKGPDTFFRAYLLTAVTRIARRRNVAAGKVSSTDDDQVLDTPVQQGDTVLAEFENAAVSKAFKSLPERWQAVLWYLDIEGMKPAAAAPLLGLSANAVSALAIRARDGLRKEYLQGHVRQTSEEDACTPYASRLGAYAMNTLRRSSREEVKQHLDNCSRCTAALLDLSDVGAAMRAWVLPAVVGFGMVEWLTLFPAAGAGKLALALLPAKAFAGNAVERIRDAGNVAIVAGAVIVASAGVATAAIATGGFGAWGGAAQPPVAEVAPAAAPNADSGGAPAAAKPKPAIPSPAPVVSAQPKSSPAPSDLPPTVNVIDPSGVTPNIEPSSPVVPPSSLPTVAPSASPSSSPSPTQTATPTTASPSPSPTPSPTASPSPTTASPSPSPTQTATPTPTTVISGTARGFGLPLRQLVTVNFSASGTDSLGPATVKFTLSGAEQMSFGGWRHLPAGWSCSASGLVVTCTSSAPDRKDLEFSGIVSAIGLLDSATLHYEYSADGIAPFAGDLVIE